MGPGKRAAPLPPPEATVPEDWPEQRPRHHPFPLGHRPAQAQARGAATCRGSCWAGLDSSSRLRPRRCLLVSDSVLQRPCSEAAPVQPLRSALRSSLRSLSPVSAGPALVLPGRGGGASAPTCSRAPALQPPLPPRDQGRCLGRRSSSGSQEAGPERVAPPRYVVLGPRAGDSQIGAVVQATCSPPQSL